VHQTVAEWGGRAGVLALVTHQVNIMALTRLNPAEGEAIVLRPAPGRGFEVVGSVRF
jgi:hypothetical protein